MPLKSTVRGVSPQSLAIANMSWNRTFQISQAVGGIATRLLGNHYLGLSFDPQKHASILKSTLGNLKGPVMKIAQFLSTIPGAIPEEYQKILADLQVNAPPMGPRFVARRLVSELGPSWSSKFRSFEGESRFAASIGQVHQALHLNGEKLACKLQYPQMEATLEEDLKHFQRVLSFYESSSNPLQTSAIQEEIRE